MYKLEGFRGQTLGGMEKLLAEEDCFWQGHLCLGRDRAGGVFRGQMTLNQTGVRSHGWEELKPAVTVCLVVEWEVGHHLVSIS